MSNRFRIASGAVFVALAAAMPPSIASADTPEKGGAQCSEPPPSATVQVDSTWAAVVIDYTVPEGWSVWRCLAERFSADSTIQLMTDRLQEWIDNHPALTVRNVKVVPAGYTFSTDAGGGMVFIR